MGGVVPGSSEFNYSTIFPMEKIGITRKIIPIKPYYQLSIDPANTHKIKKRAPSEWSALFVAVPSTISYNNESNSCPMMDELSLPQRDCLMVSYYFIPVCKKLSTK